MRSPIAVPVLIVAVALAAIISQPSTAQTPDFIWALLPGTPARALGIDEAGSYPLRVCGETEDMMGYSRGAVWLNDGVGGWVLELLPGTVPMPRGLAFGVMDGCPGPSDAVACGIIYDQRDLAVPVKWGRMGGTWMLTPLPTLGGGTGEALGLGCDADFEYFVGFATIQPVANGDSEAAVQTFDHAIFWSTQPPPNDVKMLPDYGPTFESTASGIDHDPVNDRLYVTGWAENLTGDRRAQVWVSANAGAMWTRVELPHPPGGAAWSLGTDPGCGNNRVWVVGRAGIAGVEHPVAWESLDMGMTWTATDLGVPAGYTSAVGFGGTTAGDLGSIDFWVGAGADAQAVREALYWYDDMGNLESGPVSDLLVEPTIAHLTEARAMDRSRRIAGWGTFVTPSAETAREADAAHAYAVADTDTVAWVMIPVSGSGVDDTPSPRLDARLEAKPNPFNPTVEITFAVPAPGRVTVTVYDTAGREVAWLYEGVATAGAFRSLEWHGRDASGQAVGSGVYFVRLTSAGTDVTKKIVLVK